MNQPLPQSMIPVHINNLVPGVYYYIIQGFPEPGTSGKIIGRFTGNDGTLPGGGYAYFEDMHPIPGSQLPTGMEINGNANNGYNNKYSSFGIRFVEANRAEKSSLSRSVYQGIIGDPLAASAFASHLGGRRSRKYKKNKTKSKNKKNKRKKTRIYI